MFVYDKTYRQNMECSKIKLTDNMKTLIMKKDLYFPKWIYVQQKMI